MRKLSILLLTLLNLNLTSCNQNTQVNISPDFVLIKGGTFINPRSNLFNKGAEIKDFLMGQYEVTQKEWVAVMGNNPSKFRGDSLPVETVSWYDCVEYCIKRSIKEGLTPYYAIEKSRRDTVNKSEFDSLKYTILVNPDADGYRLPTEAEWEYAAGGGQQSGKYIYSGSNDIDEVAWHWKNSGDSTLSGTWSWGVLERNNAKPHKVGQKKANELGLYDMSGNVREWCEDWYQDYETKVGLLRSQRGGGWIGAEYRCESSNRHSFEASGKGPDQGFRVCRTFRQK